jgi:hypothetical protein
MQQGQPASGGSVGGNAPYFSMVDEAKLAVGDDPRYQGVLDAMSGLTKAIIQLDPTNLAPVAVAASNVTRACASLG